MPVRLKNKPLAGIFKRRKGSFEVRMADPPRVLVCHLELHLVPGSNNLLLLLLRLLLLLWGLLRLLGRKVVGIRVLMQIDNRIRVRVGRMIWVRVRVLLEIEGSDRSQVSVNVGRKTRNCSCLLLLMLLLLQLL